MQDVAWLAGIIDGEGSITMGFYKARGVYGPAVSIVNTDQSILDECLRILGVLGCSSTVHRRKINHLGTRPVTQIVVANHASVMRLLEIVHPYLRSEKKRVRGKAMLEFVQSRLPKSSERNESRGYTPREVELAAQVRNAL